MLKQYDDLLARVRGDGQFHGIRQLVQPNDPLVREVAAVLIQSGDFVRLAQDFVNGYTSYQEEVGDYWDTPGEALRDRYCDCDDSAILLCSILRNYILAELYSCRPGILCHWTSSEWETDWSHVGTVEYQWP